MADLRTVAALYVDPKGVYSTMPGVELWDEERDARTYAGPHPVVAHPSCSRWCRLAGLVEARRGHKRGEDGGCFAAALKAVRTWGGVLEHPAYTDAFREFGLGQPPRTGGWQRELCGGFTCHVEQGRYGHPAKKATWLYACNVEIPDLRWGYRSDAEGGDFDWLRRPRALVSRCANHGGEVMPRVGKKAASATPPSFARELVSMARTARGGEEVPQSG